MADLLVFQHHPGAGPSAFTEVLDSRTSIAPWRLVEIEAAEDVPSNLDDVAGLIVMGGSMSAVEPDALPWMPAELELLRSAVEQEVPVLGVCLGAQLLGAALGGTVTQRDVPQIGYLELTRTPEAAGDPVIGGWQDGAAQFFLHEDEVSQLPDGAVQLMAGGTSMPAWRYGSAWAVQFHPEVDAEQLSGWVMLDKLAPLLEAADVDRDTLLEEARRRERSVVPLGRALVGRFIDAVVRPRLEA